MQWLSETLSSQLVLHLVLSIITQLELSWLKAPASSELHRSKCCLPFVLLFLIFGLFENFQIFLIALISECDEALEETLIFIIFDSFSQDKHKMRSIWLYFTL